MNVLSEGTINVVLPILIVILTFLIKLIVNHNFTWVGLGEELIRLPGDISTLAISFITTFILIISSKNDSNLLLNALVYLVVFFITTLFAFSMSKKAADIYYIGVKKASHWWSLVGILLCTYTASVVILYIATQFLLLGVNSNV